MAVTLSSRHAADEEARAEVEVLNSRLEKTSQLTKKIQASLTRLETSGRSVQDAIAPIYGNTQRLQIMGTNIDSILSVIDRFRQPSDIQGSEESIIRGGLERAGLAEYLASMKRLHKGLTDLKSTNLKSNQQALTDMTKLLNYGKQKLEKSFERILLAEVKPIEPLHYITKNKPFPLLPEDKTTRLGPINALFASIIPQATKDIEDSPTARLYANARGPFLTATLQNLAAATLNTAKKKTPDALYKVGTTGMAMYASGMEGLFIAEYDNICALFPREDWGRVFEMTCESPINELTRTLRELNTHIKAHLTTDCFLAFELLDIVTMLSNTLEARTGELRAPLTAALKPVKETAKSSLGELLEDTRRRILSLQALPADAAALPITSEVMARMQSMVDFLRPVSSVMISLGDGGWKKTGSANGLQEVPSLNSFDVTADGKLIFAHYCADTIDVLMTSYDSKARVLMKNKSSMGTFLANNLSVIERMIMTSELKPLLMSQMNAIEVWRKKATSLYLDAWKDTSAQLLDVQYTNRASTRPTSGGVANIDSTAIVKALSSKDKDSIKEKFRSFNTTFDELVARHKSLSMEKDVREMLAKQVQQQIEPLYGRFWDRYHEIDKGKGKYVKYDKGSISSTFMSLA